MKPKKGHIGLKPVVKRRLTALYRRLTTVKRHLTVVKR